MSRRNSLHSFTLWPRASEIVSKVKRGRKSEFVSKAVIWYDTPKAQQARNHQELIERYREAMLRIVELEKNQSFISKMRKKFSK